MIELFLNPNNEEMMDDIDFENGENRSAEKLARNSKTAETEESIDIWAYLWMSTRVKGEIEERFNVLWTCNKDESCASYMCDGECFNAFESKA